MITFRKEDGLEGAAYWADDGHTGEDKDRITREISLSSEELMVIRSALLFRSGWDKDYGWMTIEQRIIATLARGCFINVKDGVLCFGDTPMTMQGEG